MGGHAEGAVPLVQGEEERSEVQRDEDAHPHGPVQRPHEGSNGSCCVSAANLVGHKETPVQETALIQMIIICTCAFVQH